MTPKMALVFADQASMALDVKKIAGLVSMVLAVNSNVTVQLVGYVTKRGASADTNAHQGSTERGVF